MENDDHQLQRLELVDSIELYYSTTDTSDYIFKIKSIDQYYDQGYRILSDWMILESRKYYKYYIGSHDNLLFDSWISPRSFFNFEFTSLYQYTKNNKIDIMNFVKNESQEIVVKTHWLRLIQRKWKRIYNSCKNPSIRGILFDIVDCKFYNKIINLTIIKVELLRHDLIRSVYHPKKLKYYMQFRYDIHDEIYDMDFD